MVCRAALWGNKWWHARLCNDVTKFDDEQSSKEDQLRYERPKCNAEFIKNKTPK